MKANQWYKRFYEYYYDDKTISKLDRTGKSDQEGVWTPAMMGLLRRIGEDLHCEVSEERGVAGGGRSDQRWVKDNASLVYIEHENRCDEKIDGEIHKLCNDVSKLKVLITYVADRQFDDNVARLNQKIQRLIHECRATFCGELLLVVSGYCERDWEPYISVLRMEPLKSKGGQT
ncbi:MAG: hypothetical protein ACRD2L_26625 [Terriglobia bacterium]